MEKPTEPIVVDEQEIPSSDESTPPSEELKPRKKINPTRLFHSLRLWTFITIISLVFISLLRFTLLELGDKSYHVQAFRVPVDLAIKGYDGITTAYLLLDDVNQMIRDGNVPRSIKDIEEYNQSAESNQMQVEVSGVGISSEAISAYLRKMFGIPMHTIGGEVVQQGNNLKLFLRISGSAPEVVTQVIDSMGVEAAFEKLIQQGAEGVLKKNNPMMLGMYYATNSDYRAVDAFRLAVQVKRYNNSDVYAWWADFLYWQDEDTTSAMPFVRKALALDSTNATAYNVWGCMIDHFPFENRVQHLRKALKLDPSWVAAWNDLGHAIKSKPEMEEEAIACFKQATQMDSTYGPALRNWADVLFMQGKVDEAYEKLERLHYLYPNPSSIMPAAFLIARGDNAQAKRYMEKHPTIKKENLIWELNSLAYQHELRKNYDIAFKLVRFAIAQDSVHEVAAYPYSTLAELYALTGNKEAFYTYTQKAIKLGFDFGGNNALNIEPYKSLKDEPRLQRLIAQASNKVQ